MKAVKDVDQVSGLEGPCAERERLGVSNQAPATWPADAPLEFPQIHVAGSD
jgi:hypothetical protein